MSGRTQLGIPGAFNISCEWTLPPHAKGDTRITETATVIATASGGRTVTATASRTIIFREPERKCGSFRARRRTYDVKTTAPDFTCTATRRALKRCRTRHKRPKGFRSDVSKTGSAVSVWKPKRVPNDRMTAVARR